MGWPYVTRKLPTTPTRWCLDMEISVGCRWRGKLLKTWTKMLRKNPIDLGTTGGLWKDRVAWNTRIHVVNFENVANEL